MHQKEFIVRSTLSTAVLGLAAGLVGLNAPAHATAFGPAEIGYSTDSSNVSYDLAAGTLAIQPGVSFTYNGGNDSYFNDVSNATPGSAFNFAGLIHFSTVEGTLLPINLPGLITVTTPSTGTYSFSADKVGTAALLHNAVDGDRLTLYLEGMMGGGNDNQTPTETDVVLNLTNADGVGGTVSGTIFNPPTGTDPFLTAVDTPIPEPATIAVLGFGLAGLLVLRRGRPASAG
jgi:hypothetical protein